MGNPVQITADNATADLVSKIVTPFWEKLKLLYNKYMVPTPEHFMHYTKACYDSLSNIKCLALDKAVLPLKEVYVPLTIRHSRTDETLRMGKYNPNFFKKYRKVLIVDTAGMGKSTLVKRLFLDIVDGGHGIPIFIELRRLNNDNTLLRFIINQLSFFRKEFSPELLYSVIRDGDFIFIFDGYDEIPLSDKKQVTEQLQDFISHARENRFIMTSRNEIALSAFTDFELFSIKPLKRNEAFELLRKYDTDDKEHSTLLISKLKESNLFDEFLGNPLLTSMLLTAFSYKEEIPRQKHIFYRNVFDALFNAHDFTKGGAYKREKHSGLLIEDFHKVLRFIGIICLKKGKIEFTKDEFIDIIELALKQCPGISCSAGDYFEDVLRTVPLFIKDGVLYRWAHKSIFEYFAAEYICRNLLNKGPILESLSSDENLHNYLNILDLYYEIDYQAFRQYIIRPFFKEFVDYIEQVPSLTPEVLKRRECTFVHRYVSFTYKNYSSTSIVNCFKPDILYSSLFSFNFSESPFSYIDFNTEYETASHTIATDIRTTNYKFVEKASSLFSISVIKEDNFRADTLITLLEKKGHPCIAPSENKTCIVMDKSKIKLKKSHFVLDESPWNALNVGGMDIITTSILSLLTHLKYDLVKDELKIIDDDIASADEFEARLASF